MKKICSSFKLFMLGIMLILSSCSKDNGEINLKFSSSASSGNVAKDGTSVAKTLQSGVVINTFQIAIREVDFYLEGDETKSSSKLRFTGPYFLNLLEGGSPLSQTIGSSEVPDGVYKEIRFKLHKGKEIAEDDPLYDKCIYIDGTINNIPFEMWHDTSENLDVGKPTGVLVEDGVVNFEVNFDIDMFLSSLNQIDLTQAKDGNNDEKISINPDDDEGDGNKELAAALKENIKASAKILEGK